MQLKYSFSLMFFLLILSTGFGQDQSDDSINTKKLLESKLISSPIGAQFSIAMISGNNIEYIGIIHEKDGLNFITNKDSIFEIGSITKTFTSTLLANFVLDKKIKLTDRVDKSLPYKFNKKAKLQFVQLANHTSGLPRLPSNIINAITLNPDNPYSTYSKNEFNDYFQNIVNLNNKPGFVYEYSNLAVGLLGYTLETIENKSYEELLQEYIFQKHGLSNSTVKRSKIKSHLVSGRTNEGKITSNWDFKMLGEAGQIYSSTNDLSKYIMAHFDKENKDLELTRTKTFQVNDNMDMGLGWHIIKNETKFPYYFHNGGTGGYTSSCVFDPIEKKGIIVLSNIANYSSQLDPLSFQLIKRLSK